MCGIVGIVSPRGRFAEADMRRALDALHHRGPDGSGIARFDLPGDRELWLGQVRLAIVDLSPGGHQPMVREGRGAIVFNGEVYDHRDHRAAMDVAWRSRSDTEVLLEGVLREGPGFFGRINAMLACAVFDARANTLTLARDRLGKKPLYLYESDGVLAFASELKAFVALGLRLTESPLAWAYYRWLGYVPGTQCIYEQCRKFEAASYAVVELGGSLRVSPRSYWDPFTGLARRYRGTRADARAEVEALLDDATRLRLDADVPVGIYLSGGIDSSLVAASVAAQHGRKATAYVVKAYDAALDESERAIETARRLGLDVEVLPLAQPDYDRQIPRLATHFDEPHATLSAVAMMALSERAKRSVSVVLTGDGGDEVFVGYPWFGYPRTVGRVRDALRRVPGHRSVVAGLRRWPARQGLAAGLYMAGLNPGNALEKLDIVEASLDVTSAAEIYEHFLAIFPRKALTPADRELLGTESLLARARRWYPGYDWDAAARSDEELTAALDLVLYLRDDVLQKVDRATMTYSIEARSPLLDYRLVELGHSLPVEWKASGGTFKTILREAAARRVDDALAKLPKRGFGIGTPDGVPKEGSPGRTWSRLVAEQWTAEWSSGASVQGSAANPEHVGRSIALFIPDLRGGGAEKVCVLLANEMVARGIDVDIVLMKRKGVFLGMVDARVRLVELGAKRMRNVIGPLANYLAERRPDAIVANMWPLTIFTQMAAVRADYSGRVLLVEHNAWSEAWREYGHLQSMLIRSSMGLFYRGSPHVFAVSEGAARSLETYAGLKGGSVTTIYNPIPRPEAGSVDAEASICPVWSAAKHRIVSVGRMKEQKNHALLLEAFARVRRSVDAHLLLLGDGELLEPLRAQATQLGIADYVHMPGFVEDPLAYVRQADVFVLSSDWEGFANVVVEALSVGTPVVSTNCKAGPSEILGFGRYGRLVPTRDAPALAEAIVKSLGQERKPEVLMKRAEYFSVARATTAYVHHALD